MNPLDVAISVPTNPPDKADSVVILNCEPPGNIQTDPIRLLQPTYPVETLRAFDGELHGGLRFGPGKKTDDVVMDWKKPGQFISWSVRLDRPVTYEVAINYDADTESSGNTFEVAFTHPEQSEITMKSETLFGIVKPGKQQTEVVGHVRCYYLPQENFQIQVKAKDIKGGELFRLRKLELRPVPVK